MALGDTAKLLASLGLEASGFTKGLKDAEGSLGKFEGRLGKIGGIAAQGAKTAGANLAKIGAVAAGVIATQVFAGIRSLEELERVTNATEGVIKSTGGVAGVTAKQIRDMAQALESVTTADDKVIEGGAGLLLTFTNIGKDVFPQATKSMVDLGIAMAQGDVANADFKSSAIQLGKALNDPIKGITALSRVGVSFTKEQKEQIKTLVESGKTMEAQKVILAELEREFGEAGKAAGKGFGADMRRFKDAVEDAQQALAVGFLPLITKVSGILSKELAKPETIAAIKSFGESLAGGLDQLLSAAKNIPWSSIGDAMKLAGQGAKAVLDLFVSMPPWVQTAVLTGWGLNKLTGGALGGIVGELGKGLIKGVLGMNAGVVNLNAAVVNGGGLPGAGGKSGGVPPVVGAGGAAAGGFLAPGAMAAAVALAVPFAMFYGIPAIAAALRDPNAPGHNEQAPIKTPGGGTITGPNAGIVRLFTPGLADVQNVKVVNEVKFGGRSLEVRDQQAVIDASRAVVEEVKIARDRAASDAASARGVMTQQASELARMRQIPININLTAVTTVTVRDVVRKTQILSRIGTLGGPQL
jgi:hypothetical protein